MRIYIIGFMGSGKTTFGQQLADLMGYGFIDLDKEIENAEKTTVSAVFEDKGEEYFRSAEHIALLNTEKEDNMVVATGGGTPCFHDNMAWMTTHGITIYLKLFESELEKRLAPEMNTRPLLKNIAPDALGSFIYKALRERAYYYHQAQMVIYPMEISAKDLFAVIQADYM